MLYNKKKYYLRLLVRAVVKNTFDYSLFDDDVSLKPYFQYNKTLTFADFCSGIGGGRFGLESAGMKCVLHSEINDSSNKTYEIFFGKEKNLGDLTALSFDCLRNIDVLIAGFPCQTFSIVGKRAGFEDERGQIVFYLSKILKTSNVPYFILENVKGLVNHNRGNTLNSIIELLRASGYQVSYKVLSSLNYGVPQDRERVYFVGIRNDLAYAPFVFPTEQKQVNIKDFLLDNNTNELSLKNPTFQKYLNNKYNKGRVDISKILEKDYTIIDTRQSDLRVYNNYCPTLRTGRHGIIYTRNKRLYKLNGQEALLLQGFPREKVIKTEGISDTLILSQAGNAMTVNVIKAIGEKLINYIEIGENRL